MDLFLIMISEILVSIASRFRSDNASEDQTAASALDIWHSGILVAGFIALVVAAAVYFAF